LPFTETLEKAKFSATAWVRNGAETIVLESRIATKVGRSIPRDLPLRVKVALVSCRMSRPRMHYILCK
jgi:hypothetical protein